MIVIDNPSKEDGKLVVVTTPSSRGLNTWFCGAGDDEAGPKRGEGADIDMSFAGPETKTIELDFVEPFEVHDGQLWYTPVADWNNADKFSFSVYIPPVTVTPNAGAGNVNEVDTGQGYNVYLPAAGDGSHDADLSVAVPVVYAGTGPDSAGHWVVDRLTGLASARPAEVADATDTYYLLSVPVESFFIKRVPMGNPLGVFDIDTYEAEWISSAWKVRIKVERVTAGAGDVGGWLMLFREKTT